MTGRISFAEFELDTDHRRLYRNGEAVALNARTFDVLELLISRNGELVTKDEIMASVWNGQFVEDSNLSVQVSALRKALGDKTDAPRFLITVPGKGYKFIAEVSGADADALLAGEAAGPGGEPGVHEEPSRRRGLFTLLGLGGLTLIVVIAVAIYRYVDAVRHPNIESIAVLPFVGQNENPELDYLSEGVAESTIHSLSGAESFRVISRNSSFRFRGNEADLKAIGRELNVQAVLTGRLVMIGDNLSVSAELVSTDDNSVLWGEQFTRKMSDIEKLQADIANSIAQRLRLKLSPPVPREVDPEAYRLYLLGRYQLNRLTDDGFRKAAENFRQATEKDANYSLAYSGLAESYHRLSGYNAVAPSEGFPKAREAAIRALELDPSLADAHATLAMTKFFYDWDWAGAENQFRKALELDPNSAESHQMFAYYLSAMGRFDAALTEMQRARELDPLSVERAAGVGEVLYLQRKYDEAIAEFQKALDIEPNSGFANWAIGRALLEKGSSDEAVSAIQKSIPLSGDSPDEFVELARVYARVGRTAEAVEILERVKESARGRYIAPVPIGTIYAEVGDKDEAFAWFEKGLKERDFLLVLLNVDPMFDRVRGDTRFDSLVERVGLKKRVRLE